MRRYPTPTRKTSKNVGILAEVNAAVRLNANLTRASGAMDSDKGDMNLPAYKIESKATEKDSMSLKLEWLCKIAQEAFEMDVAPALIVQFVTGDGRPRESGSWVLIPESVFKELIEDGD